MTPFDRLSAALDCMEEDVRRIERLRFIEALNESRLPCTCARWTADLGYHSDFCPFPVEAAFHERVLKALSPIPERSVDGTVVPQSGNSTGLSADGGTQFQRSLTGDGVTA